MHFLHLVVCASCLLLTSFIPKPSSPKAYALLIGTKSIDQAAIRNTYFKNKRERVNYGPLTFLNGDMNSMSTLLAVAGFDKKNINPLVKDKLSLADVRDAFTALQRQSKAGDLVLVYFTGHGDQIVDRDQEERDGLDEVLVLYNELLVDDEVNLLLDGFEAGVRKVLIVDACHSGSTNKMMKSSREMLKSASDKNFAEEKSEIKKATISAGTCQLFRSNPDAANGKTLVYFGASADNETAKASTSGSYFTTALLAKFNPPSLQWRQLNYRTLFCDLRNTLSGTSSGQTVHYEEVGKADYATEYLLKIK